MSLDSGIGARRRRIRPDDVGTVPVPHETLGQVAEKWHASLRERTELDAFLGEVTDLAGGR